MPRPVGAGFSPPSRSRCDVHLALVVPCCVSRRACVSSARCSRRACVLSVCAACAAVAVLCARAARAVCAVPAVVAVMRGCAVWPVRVRRCVLRVCVVGVVWSVWPVGAGCVGWRVGGGCAGWGVWSVCAVLCGRAVWPVWVGWCVWSVCAVWPVGGVCGLACRGWVCGVGHRGGVVCVCSLACAVLWVGLCLIGHRYGVCWGVGGGYGWAWLTGWLVWLPPGWLRLLDIVLHLTVVGVVREGGCGRCG